MRRRGGPAEGVLGPGTEGGLRSARSPVPASPEFWNVGEHRLTWGMLPENAAFHPEVLIQQVWCGAQETAPQEPRLPPPTIGHFMFKPENLSTQLNPSLKSSLFMSKQGRNKRTNSVSAMATDS